MPNHFFQMFANVAQNETPVFSLKSQLVANFTQHHIFFKVCGTDLTVFLNGVSLKKPETISYIADPLPIKEETKQKQIRIRRRKPRQPKSEKASWRKPEAEPNQRVNGKLRIDAARLFQIAYGLNGYTRSNHENLIQYTMQIHDCSKNAVLTLLYGNSYNQELATLRSQVPDYEPQKNLNVDFSKLKFYHFDEKKQSLKKNLFFKLKMSTQNKEPMNTTGVALLGGAIGTAALILSAVNTTSINTLNDKVATLEAASGVTPPSSTLADGTVWVGDAANMPTAVFLSGGATMDNAGVVTLHGETLTEVGLYTLPTADGTSNQVLVTDGAGELAWVTPTTVSVSGLSRFYGLTAGTGNVGASDFPGTIAGGAPVPFARNGFVSGGIVRSSTTAFVLPGIGSYRVAWTVHVNEPGQLQLTVDGVAVASSTTPNMNPTSGGHPINGDDIVTTTSVNSLLRVINPAGNSPALLVVTSDGASTHANSQSLTIQRVA